MRIAFTGPQGSGKSTILQQCKDSGLFDGYVFVPSATRMLRDKYNLKINQESNDTTQKYIADWYADQHKNHHHKNAIYDRCVLDGMVYTEYLYNNKKVSIESYDYIRDVYEQFIDDYDIIFYTSTLPLVADGTRCMDITYLHDIDTIFKKYIKDITHKLHINKIWKLHGDKEQRFKFVTKVVNNYVLEFTKENTIQSAYSMWK